MKKLVSIIVPIYNVEAYLPRCMESLLAQTEKNLDIILVNDGSTDGCAAIADHFAETDQRIRVINKENGGLSSARNAGLEAAEGKYIYFMDPDDYIEVNLVEKSVKSMEKGVYDMCVFRTRHTYGSVTEFIPDIQKEIIYDWKNDKEQSRFFASILFDYRIGWGVCGRMFRRSLIDKTGLRFVSERDIFAEDLLFTYSYLLSAKSVLCIPDCLYHYISRADSLINTAKRDMAISKYNELMREAFLYTKKLGVKRSQEVFFVYYTILLGNYAKNLWLHEKHFSLLQVREQFLNAKDTDFMLKQIEVMQRHKNLIYRSLNRIRGGVLVSLMTYMQTGNCLRFYAEVIPLEICLYIKKRLHRSSVKDELRGVQADRR